MKTKWLVLSSLVLSIAATPGVRAAQAAHEEHEGKEGVEEKAPDSLAAVWDEIKEHQEELHGVIQAGKLDDVHHHAFALRDMVMLLPKFSSSLSADQSAKLKTWSDGVADSASKLDEYGDAGDKASTEKEVKRMDTLVSSLEKLYPSKEAGESVMYTCSMHPGVVQKGPGKCPKCGMDLLPKDQVKNRN